MRSLRSTLSLFFFFNDTATTEIYTLSLHDALPISRFIQKAPARAGVGSLQRGQQFDGDLALEDQLAREEHHAHATPAEAPLQHVATGQRAVERAMLGIEVS